MKANGKAFEPVVYDGAGHGFMRAGEAADATPDNRMAMERGWERHSPAHPESGTGAGTGTGVSGDFCR